MSSGEIVIPREVDGIPLVYHCDNVRLFIVRGQEPDFPSIEPGAMVELALEPDNEYDSGAVMAVAGGVKLGYLYKGRLQDMVRDFKGQNCPILSHVASVDDENGIITIYLAFYRRQLNEIQKLYLSKCPSKIFRLTGNKNEDMQSALVHSNEDDEITCAWDWEKEKYVADNGMEIGYFPKSADKWLIDEHKAFIDEIDLGDDLKYWVKAVVFKTGST